MSTKIMMIKFRVLSESFPERSTILVFLHDDAVPKDRDEEIELARAIIKSSGLTKDVPYIFNGIEIIEVDRMAQASPDFGEPCPLCKHPVLPASPFIEKEVTMGTDPDGDDEEMECLMKEEIMQAVTAQKELNKKFLAGMKLMDERLTVLERLHTGG